MNFLSIGILSLLSVLSVSPAFASKVNPFYTWSTAGDALDLVEIQESHGKASLKITYPGDNFETWTIPNGLSRVRVGDSDTLKLTKDDSTEFGGGTFDAGLLLVEPEQKHAILAVNGIVYDLICLSCED